MDINRTQGVSQNLLSENCLPIRAHEELGEYILVMSDKIGFV